MTPTTPPTPDAPAAAPTSPTAAGKGTSPARPPSAAVVTLQDAAFSYGRTDPVLTGVTGEVHPGQALALIGPNGAGKSTLLHGLLGMVRLAAGQATVAGAAPGRAPRGTIGYVPQVAELDITFPLTVMDVVLQGPATRLGLFRLPDARCREGAREALAAVGLADAEGRRFGELSGGQRQRVLVARAVAAGPRLVLLDEPFNGLDQPNRDALLTVIEDLKSQGVGVVVSTHDLVLARETCELVALLAGRQVAFGPRQEVLVPELLDVAYAGTGTARP